MPSFLHSLKELDHAEHAPVVGDGQAVHPQLFRLLDQVGNLVGPVQQAVMGVDVQVRELRCPIQPCGTSLRGAILADRADPEQLPNGRRQVVHRSCKLSCNVRLPRLCCSGPADDGAIHMMRSGARRVRAGGGRRLGRRHRPGASPAACGPPPTARPSVPFDRLAGTTTRAVDGTRLLWGPVRHRGRRPDGVGPADERRPAGPAVRGRRRRFRRPAPDGHADRPGGRPGRGRRSHGRAGDSPRNPADPPGRLQRCQRPDRHGLPHRRRRPRPADVGQRRPGPAGRRFRPT